MGLPLTYPSFVTSGCDIRLSGNWRWRIQRTSWIREHYQRRGRTTLRPTKAELLTSVETCPIALQVPVSWASTILLSPLCAFWSHVSFKEKTRLFTRSFFETLFVPIILRNLVLVCVLNKFSQNAHAPNTCTKLCTKLQIDITHIIMNIILYLLLCIFRHTSLLHENKIQLAQKSLLIILKFRSGHSHTRFA